LEATHLRQRNQERGDLPFLGANPIHHSLVLRLGHSPWRDEKEVVELVPDVVRDVIGHSEVMMIIIMRRDRGTHIDDTIERGTTEE
jgi:hypothetical protein